MILTKKPRPILIGKFGTVHNYVHNQCDYNCVYCTFNKRKRREAESRARPAFW